MATACVACGKTLGAGGDAASACPWCGVEQLPATIDSASQDDVYQLLDEPPIPTRGSSRTASVEVVPTPPPAFASLPPGLEDADATGPYVPDDRTLTYVALKADGAIEDRVIDGRLSPFAAGAVLQDRYELVRELGRGGMGLVFLGTDRRLGRSVAIKVMLPGRRERSAEEQGLMERLFTAEARLGASLNHPAIAAVYDFGLHAGRPYTVFEYVPGMSLREFLERRGGRLPLDEVLLFLAPIAQALDFAHARRVVHRDLKPDNIRVTPEGQFKILDLGLAKEFDREQDWRFAGTPAYAAPEQCAELPPDGRTDQYALAAIVYEMVLGRRLFLARDPHALLQLHRQEKPTLPRKVLPTVNPRVEAALMKSLEKDPNRRFVSCEAFAREMGCQYLSEAVEAPEVLLQAAVRPDVDRFTFVTGKQYWVLTPRDLYSCYEDEIKRWPVGSLKRVEPIDIGRSLRVFFAGERFFNESFDLRLNSWRKAKLWAAQLEELVGDRTAAVPGATGGVKVKDVVAIRDRPNVRYQVLGPVEAQLRGKKSTEAALKMIASGMEADAVVEVQSRRVPLFHKTVRVMSGTAVRVQDAAGRLEMRRHWFDWETGRVGSLMLLMLLIFAISGFFSIALAVIDARSRNPGSTLNFWVLYGIRMLWGAWPLLMACALKWLRWPQLTGAAARSFFTLGTATPIGMILGGLAS
ncbi:MAG: serine/threonine-protein kinase, partial [Isosphaeraceae bacterium]